MIKGLTGGHYIAVTNGYASDPHINPGAVGSGMMRYNGNMNCIEINDGNIWKQLGMSYASVDLTGEAVALLDWAKKKKTEEDKIDELCKKYPGLGKARDNYEVFLKLVQSEESV